ncbi:hypothetical protein [Halalkalibacter oceani]|uniref:hypothetical protein n=1 Tax=Halalkalibacter oceani TaxID=1653776 RepID=UPI0033916E19
MENKVVNLVHKKIEKQYQEISMKGVVNSGNEGMYWRNTERNIKERNIDKSEARRNMIKGYMNLLSKQI